MRTDSIFYQLFQLVPSILFELMGESASKYESYEFSTREVKELSFRFDGIYLPITNDLEQLIYFVEVQYRKRDSFYWDLFGEIGLYNSQYQPKQDWRAVAIFAKESFDPGPLKQYQEFFDSGRVSIVYLDRLSQKSSPSSLGLRMIELVQEPEATAGNKARELAQQTRQQITADETQDKILELIDKILVYKFPQLSRQELDRMFTLDELKQTRYFQDVQQEARVETTRNNILQILKVRFTKDIPPKIVEKLNQIEDLSCLDEIHRKAVTAKSLAEFRSFLKQPPDNRA